MATITKDRDWIRQAFMLPRRAVTEQEMVRRVLTDAQYKFTDTTLGGNFAINPPPQWTRFADPPVMGQFTGSTGMGDIYSSAIDDHGLHLHMRFGVPQFNSLTNFFFNFYNPQASHLARTGRSTSSFYKAGRAIGYVVTLPLQGMVWMGSVIRFLANKPTSRFYYLKPAMPLYWNAVSTIVNRLVANTMSANARNPAQQSMRADDLNMTAEDAEAYHDVLSDILLPGGGIDVYAVANRAQRLSRVHRARVNALIESGTGMEDISRRFAEFDRERITDPGSQGLAQYLENYTKLQYAIPKSSDNGDDDLEETGEAFNSMASYKDHAMAELEDGSQFVTFRVDNPGTVGESFSTEVGESELANKVNSMSAAARSTRFSFADGNVGAGIIGDTIGGVFGAVKDLVAGAGDAIGIAGVAALGGSAFVDIPKVWLNSTADMPTASYTIQLRTPYGDELSRMMNLYVPLAMLLASILPLQTGKQSYTSPFLCEYYVKGHTQARLAMVKELSFSRGEGNTGWTKDNQPLGIDVTLTLIDMSSVMTMPISPNFSAVDAVISATTDDIARSIGALGEAVGFDSNVINESALGNGIASAVSTSTYDDDNSFTDYLAVLGSLSLADQIYPTNKLRLRFAARMNDWEQWRSPAHHANWTMGTFPARMISALTHYTDRR